MKNQARPPIRPTPASVAPTAMPAVAPVERPPPPSPPLDVGCKVGTVGVTVTVVFVEGDGRVARLDAIVSSTVLV